MLNDELTDAACWTIPQAAVWIRTRDLGIVEELTANQARSLVLAADIRKAILAGSDCLRAALKAGRLAARGKASADIIWSKIPESFWQDGEFSDNGDGGVGAWSPSNPDRYSDLTVQVDKCMRHWPSLTSILAEGPITMLAALEGLTPEGPPDWFLGHPAVIATGLNERGDRVPIDRAVFLEPYRTDHVGNALMTGDGGLRWSAVMVDLGVPSVAPMPGDRTEVSFNASDIAAWAKPIIDRVLDDGRQLKREQFTELVLGKFDRDAQGTVIAAAWEKVAPKGWRQAGLGRLPDRKVVDDWRPYLAQKDT